MKITSYDLEQKATSTYTRLEKTEIEMQTVRISQRPVQRAIPPVDLAISDDALQVTKAEYDDMFNLSDEDKAKIKMIEDFISYLTGKKFKFKQFIKMDEEAHAKTNQSYSQPAVVADKANPEVSVESAVKEGLSEASAQLPKPVQMIPQGMTLTLGKIHAKHVLTESETMTFQSQGTVKTADGKSIDFNVNLEMAYEHTESQELLIESASIMVDPIVINFDGKGVNFGEDHLELDITLDGKAETFRNLAQGSGFLALDKNGNGQIDDGSELFGPKTGSGFSELAGYDSDQNGWIDESDDIYKSLKVWTVNPAGEKTLIGLKEADVGAIYLGKVASEYNMRSDGDVVARLRESSVYLKESGGAGAVHEIDLKI